MNIESTYDIGQKVWAIQSDREEYKELCAFCAGTGKVTGADSTRGGCPKCYGRGGESAWHDQAWRVGSELTIGQVRVLVTSSPGIDDEDIFDNFKPQLSHVEEYMCVETGVGSGSIWPDHLLFDTRDEAQAACDERNAQTKAET